MLTSYLVISPHEGSVDAAAIEKAFAGRHHELVPGHVWAVAASFTTAVDVCEALGLGGFAEGSDLTGVVVKMSDYNGYAERGLWERLRAWATDAAT